MIKIGFTVVGDIVVTGISSANANTECMASHAFHSLVEFNARNYWQTRVE